MPLDHEERKEIREQIKNQTDNQALYLLEKINGYARSNKKQFEVLKENENKNFELLKKLYTQTLENGSQIEILNAKHEITIAQTKDLKNDFKEHLRESDIKFNQVEGKAKELKKNIAPWIYLSRTGQKVSRFWILAVVFLASSIIGIAYLIQNFDKLIKIIPIL